MSTLAAAAAAAAVATAHDVEFPNSVNLNKAGPYAAGVWSYRGRVNSGNPRCERRREVQVFRADVNPEVRILRTRTGMGGRWADKDQVLPNNAKIYALIETRVLLSNGAHDHICPVDRSRVRKVPIP